MAEGDQELPPSGGEEPYSGAEQANAAAPDTAGDAAPEAGAPQQPAPEPPIFGGRNPSKNDWFKTHEPEPDDDEDSDGESAEPAEELEGLLPSREKREAIARELLSPFAVLLFFIFSLLVGIATVNISIPASATLRARIRYENFKQLAGSDLDDFQIEQDRLLRSYETRSMIASRLREMPGGALPNFATDDLEFHHRLDRRWSADGELIVTLQSEDPELDQRRLWLLARAMVEVSSRAKLRIDDAETEIKRLQQEREKLSDDFVHMRAEITWLEPAALKQSALSEAVVAMQQYLSLLDAKAPQRVAAEQNLVRLKAEAATAREAGEKRDTLLARHMELQKKIDDTDKEIVRQRHLAARVVYPQPVLASDVTVSDLRPARYNLLWIVALGISVVFVVLLILSFLRNARLELQEREEARRRELDRAGAAPPDHSASQVS